MLDLGAFEMFKMKPVARALTTLSNCKAREEATGLCRMLISGQHFCGV